MDLLPKVKKDFAQKKYWDSFFKKRGKKAFEWYGEYLELCDQLHKYIRNKDKILIVGCGNSKLSMDLFDSGFRDIVNIDVSEIAIKQMVELNKDSRSSMKFLHMDATSMNFPEGEFSVVLDKGTLDALMPDDTDDILKEVTKYFNEIQRVLKNGGRYICISLLQEHILKFILDFFPKNNFLFRVIRCFEAEQQSSETGTDNPIMPVFIIVATKCGISTKILEISLDGSKIKRVNDATEILESITAIQKAALVCNGLNKSSIEGDNEVIIDLFISDKNTPRFTLFVLDQAFSRKNGKYAAFIVPQGREVEWLFATPQGRRNLLKCANFNRLAVVILHRDHNFGTLDDVKGELTECVRNLAPSGLKEQIPFLSLGPDVGKRNIVATGESKNTGKWIIEEVEVENSWYRRLIFESNQFVVQSEVRLKQIKAKNGTIKNYVDIGFLACQHHRFMTLGVDYVANKNTTDSILVVGLGGGALCTFIHEIYKDIKIVAIEIEPEILEIAKKFFDLKQDKRLEVIIEDGIFYLNRKAAENEIHEGKNNFNAILFDVDSKDLSLGISCPPKNFLTTNTLNAVKQLIGCNGIFILNLVCRDEYYFLICVAYYLQKCTKI